MVNEKADARAGVEKKAEEEEKEETLKELIHKICSEYVVDDDDDWVKIAPHVLDNIVPGEEGARLKVL